MIVNHRYRFFFIKTRKTAGSSVEIALSRICAPGDIVTPLGERLGEEELRVKEGGYGPEVPTKPVWQHRGYREWRRLLLRGERAQLLKGHATASEIRDALGNEIWNQYFKFTIERNPWDRAVSRYWWQQYRLKRRGRKPYSNIGECLEELANERPHWLTNWGQYTVDNMIAVDRVLFFESLETDLKRVQDELGIKENIDLPERKAKSDYRPRSMSYRDVLGERERDLISSICFREIEAFGYEF